MRLFVFIINNSCKYLLPYSISRSILTLGFIYGCFNTECVYGNTYLPDSLYITNGDTLFSWDTTQMKYVVFETNAVGNIIANAGTQLRRVKTYNDLFLGDTCLSGNMIINGSFEDDTIGWNIDYKRVSGLGYSTDEIPVYRIDTFIQPHTLSPYIWCSAPAPDGEHMIIFDGGKVYTDTVKRVLSQDITVLPGKSYLLSLKVLNFLNIDQFLSIPFINPILKISFNSDTFIYREILRSSCEWETINFIWYSDTSNTLNVSIFDIIATVFGNDFAIDDVTLKEIYYCSDTLPIITDTCYARELIVNGNFEDSLSGWGTDQFLYTTECGGCNGWYTFHSTSWCDKPDHSDIGSILLTTSPSEDTTLRLLYQTVIVSPHSNYFFSGWVMNYNMNPPIIKVSINDSIIIVYPIFDDSCTGWLNFTAIVNSGFDTSLTIAIYDARNNIYGNDFGLDDISFRQIISCTDSFEQCAYTDTFTCTTLSFSLDSSRFCVPIKLQSDSISFSQKEFNFCMTYDTAYVRPDGVYFQPGYVNGFTVEIDSIVSGKICITISDVEHITFMSTGEIDLGCIEFVLDNEPFDHQKVFDYLTFQIIDGCNIIQTINAWLMEEDKYWKTEDDKYWKLEN